MGDSNWFIIIFLQKRSCVWASTFYIYTHQNSYKVPCSYTSISLSNLVYPIITPWCSHHTSENSGLNFPYGLPDFRVGYSHVFHFISSYLHKTTLKPTLRWFLNKSSIESLDFALQTIQLWGNPFNLKLFYTTYWWWFGWWFMIF